MVDNQNPNNPNNPYNTEMPPPPGGYAPPPGGMYQEEPAEMESGMPSVAAAPGRVLVVILGGIAIVGIILFTLFSGDDEAPPPNTSIKDERETTVSEYQPAPTQPPIQPIAPPPPPVVPPPPAPPAPIPLPPPPPARPADQQQDKSLMERRKSSLMVQGGQVSIESMAGKKREVKGFAGSDPNLVFSREYLGETGADQMEATLMGNMNYIVAQGKVIDAVLETAINTDLPGPLRAIVSRDVYAESGREVMIPKGSRLIGTYNPGIKRGQKRVYVIWARIIRPDGIDIKIDSPGIDSLGRAGIAGYVDNKYFEMFAASLLTSSISIGLGIGADSALDDSGTTQTNTSDGTTTSSGSAGSQAVLEGIRDFSDTSEEILRGILEQEPTITVDQGERIKVFVNRDLIMPPAVLEQMRFIQ